MYYYAHIETILVVAKRQEAHRTHLSRDHDLDFHPGFIHNAGKYINRYHRRTVCAMGSQYLGKNDFIPRQLPSAADSDDLLLFSRCPLTTYQGIYQQHNTPRSSSHLLIRLGLQYCSP